jgi:hypothetical protein
MISGQIFSKNGGGATAVKKIAKHGPLVCRALRRGPMVPCLPASRARTGSFAARHYARTSHSKGAPLAILCVAFPHGALALAPCALHDMRSP